MNKELSIEQIKKILPHRFPMLLIDKVVDYTPGESAVAIHNVSNGEKFVKEGRIDILMLPRPIIIEALAQTGAIALLSEPEFKGKTAYFGGIQSAEFLEDAVVGDQLFLKTKLTKIRGNIGIGKAIASINKKVIATADLMFMIG